MSVVSNNTMTRKEKWIYILMIVPFYLMVAAYALTFYEYFHDHLLLQENWIYIASIIFMVVNAVNDPLLAMWSDGIDAKKWGSRRLIFIRWGGVFWAFSFAFTWIPWSTTNQILIFIQYTTFICMLDSGLSLVIMCWMALLPEMESDNQNRVKMSFYTGIFIFFASIFGSLIIFVKDISWIYFRYFAFGIAGFVIIMAFVSTSQIKERTEFHYEKPLPFWKGLGRTFKMKSFMLYVGYNLFFNVIPTSFGASFIYLYILIIPGLNPTYYFLITSLGGFIAPLIALRLKKTWGMKKTILIVGLIAIIGTILLYYGSVSLNTSILESNPLSSMIALIGIFFMSWVAAVPRTYSNTITALSMDEFEVKYGNRRETTFLGINALITKPGDSVGTMIVTAILASTYYVPEGPVEIQPLSALNGIRAFMLLIPALFMLVGLIFMIFYPFYGEKLAKLEQEIEKIHAEKKEKLLALEKEKGRPSSDS